MRGVAIIKKNNRKELRINEEEEVERIKEENKKRGGRKYETRKIRGGRNYEAWEEQGTEGESYQARQRFTMQRDAWVRP